jgi:hypothetical protein
MTDYSHLVADKISMVSRWLERGRSATDEMLLEAVEQLDRAVLCDADRAVVLAVLKRNQGRPPKASAPRLEVAASIEATDHPGLPQPLRDALAHRLRSPRGLTELKRSMQVYNELRKPRRVMFMRAIYRDILPLLGDQPVKGHPVYGDIIVPDKVLASPRHEQAAEITHILLARMGFHPPAVRRMLNIISQK